MNRSRIAILAAALLATTARAQEEAPLNSRIVAVELFKNGMTVVKREAKLPGPGTYRLESAIEPVHGTFWIDCNVPVEASTKMRDVEIPANARSSGPLQDDLAGRMVTISLRGDKLPQVKGTVVRVGSRDDDETRRLDDRHLIVATERGQTYVSSADIALIEVHTHERRTERRPTLVLKVDKGDADPVVKISYLTKGLAWAPSYRVDVSDAKKLKIEMAAVIRNEMADVSDAEFRLISGFPSVEFAEVLSPLAPKTNWKQFFAQLSNRERFDSRELANGIILNQKTVDFDNMGFQLGAIPTGEGVDLHFQSIGKRTLKKGEAFSMTVGKSQADYERVVQWNIGASSFARRHLRDYGYHREADLEKDEMWDVLVYKNPFAFPMTTAPAMVVDGDKFNGQRTANWANAGEQTTLRVTKSLSVRTTHLEEEDGRPNVDVIAHGTAYVKIFLRGELKINNHRKEAVKMVVNQVIRGAIEQIDGQPTRMPRQASLEEVNRAYDVSWKLEVPAGGERRLTYKYSVLVRR